MSKESLATRLSQDTLLREICKIVTYVGFPFRELSTRLKPMVDQYGSRKVSDPATCQVVGPLHPCCGSAAATPVAATRMDTASRPRERRTESAVTESPVT